MYYPKSYTGRRQVKRTKIREWVTQSTTLRHTSRGWEHWDTRWTEYEITWEDGSVTYRTDSATTSTNPGQEDKWITRFGQERKVR